MPAAIAQIVAIAMNEPVHVCTGEELPCPENESEPMMTAVASAPHPK